MRLIPNSHVLAQMYLSWYLLRESSEWSRYSTVSVPPKPGTLMSTPGELSVVLVLLSYSNLKQTLNRGSDTCIRGSNTLSSNNRGLDNRGSDTCNHAQIQEFSSGGVQVSLTKEALTTFFFCLFFFLVLSLFCRSQMANLTEIYHFSRFRRGSNIFQGGGGSNRGSGGGGGGGEIRTCVTEVLIIEV